MKLYNIRDLQKLSARFNFIRDNLEKVIRLTEILKYINTSEMLHGSLALKGGTAINLMFSEIPRLSVDLDFDYCADVDRDGMMTAREHINKEILAYMQSEGYVLAPNSKNPHSLDSWAFSYINAGGNKDNIKIEINYSMRQHVLPLRQTETAIGFIPSIRITTLAVEELYGSKIKALLERAAARDLFDVYNFLSCGLYEKVVRELLRKIVMFYQAVGGEALPQEECNTSVIDHLQFKQIKTQLLPMLRKGTFFDFKTAKSEVKKFIAELMLPNESERRFIREFCSKEYHPEYLFDDEAIIGNIKNHPMALWKTRK